MARIINLTQHDPSAEQIAQGVEILTREEHTRAKALLNFDEIPSAVRIEHMAYALSEIAAKTGATAAMIGGAPFLMAALERALAERGIAPLYAFSRRESVERLAPDGSTVKTAVFRHVGFVSPPGVTPKGWYRFRGYSPVGENLPEIEIYHTDMYGDKIPTRLNAGKTIRVCEAQGPGQIYGEMEYWISK